MQSCWRDGWPKALLLDFYGTLVAEDNAEIAQICDQIVKASSVEGMTAEEVGRLWGHLFEKLCIGSSGKNFQLQRELERDSLAQLLSRFGANLEVDELSQPLFDYWRRPKVFPESANMVRGCGVPICLVTNIDDADLAAALAHTEMSFDLIVTSESCRAYKPNSEPFQKALNILGMSVGEVLHVGDSLSSDIRGAKALGIRAAWINRKGRSLPDGQVKPDFECRTLNEVLRLPGD